MRILLTRLVLLATFFAVCMLGIQAPVAVTPDDLRKQQTIALFGADVFCETDQDPSHGHDHRCPLCLLHALPETAVPTIGQGSVLFAGAWLPYFAATPLIRNAAHPGNPYRGPPAGAQV